MKKGTNTKCLKRQRYQYVWYKHGEALVREKHGAQAHVVKTVNDLQTLE